MEEVIKIEGGHRLHGTVRISGSKNSTVALIPACVLGNAPITIYGVPNISDVKSLMELLRELNVYVEQIDEETLYIDPTKMNNIPMVSNAVSKLRASYYFMGALLGKFGHAEIKMPGGCYLGPRPIDLHLKGFEALGASITYENGCYILHAGTENLLMAAALAEGETVLENAAREPEIIDIATLLNKMGAKIHGMGTSTLVIDGVGELKTSGCNHEIIPDRIEAATYIIMAAAIADDMIIENVIPQHLEAILMKLEEIGINMKVGPDFVEIFGRNQELKPTEILTKHYPGFATDVQQPFTALLTQAAGQSVVTETIYTERFKHCYELNKMGADIDVRTPSGFVNGKTKLSGTSVVATDLRCGAALVVAGLMAEGITEIHDVYHIDRGYDNLDNKLRSLGAVFWREKVE